MRRCIALLIVLACRPAVAQGPAAAPPILVLDSGGHTSAVWNVLFTPDGRELISISEDKTIRFWDVASGEPIRVLRPPIGPGHGGELHAAALTPDGRTLAVGGWGLANAIGSIYLISTATGRIERVLKGHAHVVHGLAFGSPPGGDLLLASVSADKMARIWNVTTGECRRVLIGHTDKLYGVAFAPGAGRLATASYDKTARIWSVADGRCLHELRGHVDAVRCVAWNPDGSCLATGSYDRSIRLWSPHGALVRSILNLGDGVVSMTFAADSSELLYTLGGSNLGFGAAVLRASTGQNRVRFTGHGTTAAVFSSAISPDGATAATAGGNLQEIHLWRMSDASPQRRLAGKGQARVAAGWSPDGRRIAWGHTFHSTSSNNPGPLERSFSLADFEPGPTPDAASRRARESRGSLSLHLAASDRLEVKESEGVQAKFAVPESFESINGFTFARDDRVAVARTYGLSLFDARTGVILREFQGHSGDVWAVAPSPDGRYLLSASDDQTLRVWDPDRDEPLLSLFFTGDDWIAWTPEGYYAASPAARASWAGRSPTAPSRWAPSPRPASSASRSTAPTSSGSPSSPAASPRRWSGSRSRPARSRRSSPRWW